MIELADNATYLKKLEDIIQHSKERAETHWFEIGRALCKIRDGKLHKQHTFEQYCLQRWGFKRSRAYQLCKTFETLKDSKKSTAVDKMSEVSARALADVPEEQREEVLEESKKSGKPTAKSVKTAARKVAGKKGKPEHIKDKQGFPIPDRCLPIWNDRNKVREKCAPLHELKQWAEDMQGTDDPFWSVEWLDFAKVMLALESAIFLIKQAYPYAVCTRCQGQDPECGFCHGRGMVSRELAARTTPEEMLKIREKLSRSNDHTERLSGASR